MQEITNHDTMIAQITLKRTEAMQSLIKALDTPTAPPAMSTPPMPPVMPSTPPTMPMTSPEPPVPMVPPQPPTLTA